MSNSISRLSSLFIIVIFSFTFLFIHFQLPQSAHAAVAANWTTVPAPGSGILQHISAIDSNDAWAVGSRNVPDENVTKTLALHWNGQQWEETASINPQDTGNTTGWSDAFNGVAALSANDVWAVGLSAQSNGGSTTLIEHWDGTAWSVVPSANPDPGSHARLQGIEAVSSNDIWAVGYYSISGLGTRSLIEHWDGTSWSVVPTPGIGGVLNKISAVSANDIWAVGIKFGGSTNIENLVLHWDGTSWTEVLTPTLGTGTSHYELNDVTALASNDVWAVGRYTFDESNTNQAKQFILHWNGTDWNIVLPPDLGVSPNGLYGITALAPDNIWAVGAKFEGAGLGDLRPLIEHWDGTQWEVVPSPNGATTGFNFLNSIDAVAPDKLWAVGTQNGNPLIQRTILTERNLNTLNPAQVWVSKGMLNSRTKLDLLAEVYKNATLVSSGQVNGVTVGNGTFNNATLVNIPFNTFSPVDFPQGAQLEFKISVRNSCSNSGALLNNGNVQLWFNDTAANSQFGGTIGAVTNSYFLRNAFSLATIAGTGPRESITVAAGAPCSAFKPFGTWTTIP